MKETWICYDCKKEIIPPLGKPFGNGDGKTRCAACAVDHYMKNPAVIVQFKGNNIFSNCSS